VVYGRGIDCIVPLPIPSLPSRKFRKCRCYIVEGEVIYIHINLYHNITQFRGLPPLVDRYVIPLQTLVNIFIKKFFNTQWNTSSNQRTKFPNPPNTLSHGLNVRSTLGANSGLCRLITDRYALVKKSPKTPFIIKIFELNVRMWFYM
jgi:hypothetical protein